MEEINQIAQSATSQERKYHRFSLQYPVHLKVHSADLMVEFEATSRIISICGLLLEASSLIPQNTPVTFTVTVKHNELGRPIQFVGEGRVVRVDLKTEEDVFAMAVECQRPITQVDAYPEIGG
jgi:hypothetical protein